MLVFGVDVPLMEIILVFTIIVFILLVEALVIIGLLMNQMGKTKKLGDLIERISQTLLEIKKVELDKRRK